MNRKHSHKRTAMALLALLIFVLALGLSACAPAPAVPAQPAAPTSEPAKPTEPPVPTSQPATAGLEGLKPEDVLLQLTYEPGFVMPEFRFPFGRVPFFTLLADGRVIYVDELKDGKVMQAQLSPDKAAALLVKVREMGFQHLESHTDMCGKLADGSEPCIADASTSIMRVRMEDGSLREIQNYANFSNGPATYDAIYALMNEYTNPAAELYQPHAATLFVRIVPPPEQASPADWPLDPAYVKQAEAAADQGTAVVLTAEEAAKWQKEVGIDGAAITFQLEGKPVQAMFVPWLPGMNYAEEIAAQFPTAQ